MFKIKKGDTVKVIAGKDKDKEGKVISFVFIFTGDNFNSITFFNLKHQAYLL